MTRTTEEAEQWATCAVDYLTCTLAGSEGDNGLYRFGLGLINAQDPSATYRKPWSQLGYVGETLEQVSTGRRLDGSILRLSSDTAAAHWKDALHIVTNVSRLDLAVTLTFSKPQLNLALDAWKAIKQNPPNNGRPPKYTLLIDTLGGSTLYVGSRSSENYARLYDKGVESGTQAPGKAWRYEVEIKGDTSYRTAQQLYQAESEGDYIGAYVFDHFSTRCVQPRFPRGMVQLRYEIPRRPINIDSSLNWLATAVRPTLHKLCASGYRLDALKALDIS